MKHLQLARDGAELLPALVLTELPKLRHLFANLPAGAGFRFASAEPFAPIIPPIRTAASHYLGPAARPVRAIAFDKSDEMNWALGWHQDRTICVRQRSEVPGYGPWSRKQDLTHVEPPFEIIGSMLTFRIHVDAVDVSNAPLKIALGSHCFGKIKDGKVDHIATSCEQMACLADAGDVWVYRTPILHASERAETGRNRRVLQIDFSAAALPPPLQWGLD